ncbi:MAG: ribokinase [Clostridium sp.]|nr:ribokinase [Clostridium sp.]
MEKKVVVIGSLNYDVCLKQERLPDEGETYFADSVEYCSGGKGANQAVQAAKLGVPTYIVGCIGADGQGEFLKASIEGYGVRTDFLKKVEGNSGMSVAQSLYDGGVRASVVKGSNSMVSKEDVDRLDQFLQPGDIAVFQLEIPIPVVEYAIRFCRERGCYIILNGAPAAPVDEEVLKLVNLFIVNEVEAGFYCGREIVTREEAVEEIQKMAGKLGNVCIYTLGKSGSVVCSGGRTEFVPSKKVQAVESTGAGDSFIGGLCYALMGGMDIFGAARFATCCSAKTVCRTGGQPAMPVLEDVMELYQAQ